MKKGKENDKDKNDGSTHRNTTDTAEVKQLLLDKYRSASQGGEI